MSMHGYANAGPNRAALAAFIEPGDGGTVFEKIASVAAPEPRRPQPIAYCENEGDFLQPWGEQRPGRCHAIYFDDGSAFDMYNGWRPHDPERLKGVQQALAEWRPVITWSRSNQQPADVDKLYNDCLRQMIGSVAMQSRPLTHTRASGEQMVVGLNPYATQQRQNALQDQQLNHFGSQHISALQTYAANKDRETLKSDFGSLVFVGGAPTMIEWSEEQDATSWEPHATGWDEDGT